MLPFLAPCSLRKKEKKKTENTTYGLKISHVGSLARIISMRQLQGFTSVTLFSRLFLLLVWLVCNMRNHCEERVLCPKKSLEYLSSGQSRPNEAVETP